MIRLVTTGIRHTDIFRFSFESITYCGVFTHPRAETDYFMKFGIFLTLEKYIND